MKNNLNLEIILKNGKKTSKKISSKDVLSTQGKNLYEQLQQHVTMATKRPKSKNSGTDGAFTLLDEIEGFLSTRTSFLLEDEDRIEDFIDEVNDFADETSSLNPQNILFTMPIDRDWETCPSRKESFNFI